MKSVCSILLLCATLSGGGSYHHSSSLYGAADLKTNFGLACTAAPSMSFIASIKLNKSRL